MFLVAIYIPKLFFPCFWNCQNKIWAFWENFKNSALKPNISKISVGDYQQAIIFRSARRDLHLKIIRGFLTTCSKIHIFSTSNYEIFKFFQGAWKLCFQLAEVVLGFISSSISIIFPEFPKHNMAVLRTFQKFLLGASMGYVFGIKSSRSIFVQIFNSSLV